MFFYGFRAGLLILKYLSTESVISMCVCVSFILHPRGSHQAFEVLVHEYILQISLVTIHKNQKPIHPRELLNFLFPSALEDLLSIMKSRIIFSLTECVVFKIRRIVRCLRYVPSSLPKQNIRIWPAQEATPFWAPPWIRTQSWDRRLAGDSVSSPGWNVGEMCPSYSVPFVKWTSLRYLWCRKGQGAGISSNLLLRWTPCLSLCSCNRRWYDLQSSVWYGLSQ